MFSSGANYNKLKTNLRLCINRLKLLEKKKTELALKQRKEIADYLAAGKIERAKIRVEHIIREDYLVEAMEVLEMYCDLLLARRVHGQRPWNNLIRIVNLFRFGLGRHKRRTTFSDWHVPFFAPGSG